MLCCDVIGGSEGESMMSGKMGRRKWSDKRGEGAGAGVRPGGKGFWRRR